MFSKCLPLAPTHALSHVHQLPANDISVMLISVPVSVLHQVPVLQNILVTSNDVSSTQQSR